MFLVRPWSMCVVAVFVQQTTYAGIAMIGSPMHFPSGSATCKHTQAFVRQSGPSGALEAATMACTATIAHEFGSFRFAVLEGLGAHNRASHGWRQSISTNKKLPGRKAAPGVLSARLGTAGMAKYFLGGSFWMYIHATHPSYVCILCF